MHKDDLTDLIKRAKGSIDLDPKEFEQYFCAVMDEGKVVYECKRCKKRFSTDTEPNMFSREILKHKFIIDPKEEEKRLKEHFLTSRKDYLASKNSKETTGAKP